MDEGLLKCCPAGTISLILHLVSSAVQIFCPQTAVNNPAVPLFFWSFYNTYFFEYILEETFKPAILLRYTYTIVFIPVFSILRSGIVS